MVIKSVFRFLSVFLASIFVLALVGCGGGGGGSGTAGSSLPQPHPIATLAKVPSGGALNVTLSNGRAYFSNYNRGEIQSVSVNGGEVTTHYKTFGAFGNVVHQGNQIFALETQTAGQLLALPDTAVDISLLSANQNAASSTVDVVTDGTHAYWSEYDGAALTSQVLRIPLIPTGSSPINSAGASTDKLIGFALNGTARVALDGRQLFVSEGATGNIYKVDLTTGNVSTLVTALGPVSPHAFPLATAGGYLYALVNDTTIVQINEANGSRVTVTTGVSVYGNRIKSDGNAVYWLEVATPSWAFRSFTSQTGQLTNIASVSANYVGDYCIAGGQLWWFTLGAVPGTLSAQKVAVTGGTPVTVATFSSSINPASPLSLNPDSVVGDTTNLYWKSAAGILAMPQTGGTPAIVTRFWSTTSPITLTNSDIVFGDRFDTGIVKIPKTAQPITPTTISQAVFPAAQTYMTADASSLYWATDSTLSSWPVLGGPVNNLGTSNGIVDRVFPYMGVLFLARQTATGYTISAMPNTGGAEVVMISSTIPIVDLYVANDILYFTTNDLMGNGGVFTYNLTTFALTTLVPNRPLVNRLYVDSSHVYWTERSPVGSSSGGVYRIALSGGAVETIYSGYGSWDITGDVGRIYWAAGWEILSTNK